MAVTVGMMVIMNWMNVIQKPSATEVRRALKCLQDFCYCSQVEVAIINTMAALESPLQMSWHHKRKKKKTILVLILFYVLLYQ